MKETNKRALIAHRVFACIGIGVGLLSMIFGIVVLCTYLPYGRWVSSGIKYGADYYTDSYEAMAATANNVQIVSKILIVIANAVGYLLIVAGLALMISFVVKLIATFENKKNVNGVVKEQTEVTDEVNFKREVENNASTARNVEVNESIAEFLKMYKELLDSGVITQEEFEKKKGEILK